ncbi:hypothetical protein MAP00_002997 [Monascus purpureus]|nr:hypothetical protein MAP00_002997 [Monascus purpureus]
MASPSTPESTPQNEVRPIPTTTSDGLGERPPKRHRGINGESHASGYSLEGATETLLGKLDHLQRDIDILKRAVCGRGNTTAFKAWKTLTDPIST